MRSRSKTSLPTSKLPLPAYAAARQDGEASPFSLSLTHPSSPSFDPPSPSKRIVRRVWFKRTAGSELVVHRIRRERRAVAAELVAGGIRIVGIRAQFPAVVALLIVKCRRISGEGIRRRLVAEGTAVRAEGIVDPVRGEGTSLPERIAARLEVERIGAQIAEVFGVANRSPQ